MGWCFKEGFPEEAINFDLILEESADPQGSECGRVGHRRPWVQMWRSRRHDRGCCLGTMRSWAWPECGRMGDSWGRKTGQAGKELGRLPFGSQRESWRDFKQGSNCWREMTFYLRRQKKASEIESLSNWKIPNNSLGVLRRVRPSSSYEASGGELDFRCVEKGGKEWVHMKDR